jgi:hypothetical protein
MKHWKIWRDDDCYIGDMKNAQNDLMKSQTHLPNKALSNTKSEQ